MLETRTNKRLIRPNHLPFGSIRSVGRPEGYTKSGPGKRMVPQNLPSLREIYGFQKISRGGFCRQARVREESTVSSDSEKIVDKIDGKEIRSLLPIILLAGTRL
jgi:hypothetical protein